MDLLKNVEKIRQFNRYFANVLGKIDQEMYNQPYSLTEARIISELHYKSGSTAKEISEVLGIDRGYLSRILHRFEEKQLISKEQSADDKRQFALYLTTDGEVAFQKMADDANCELSKKIQHLPETEISTLVTSMETIQSIYTSSAHKQPVVTIRTFVPGDAGYVAQLHGEFYAGHYGLAKIFEFYVMKGLTDFLFDPTAGELWISEVDGKRAGSIAIVKDDHDNPQFRWFIVDHQYQGLGIGKKLLDTALNYCKEQCYGHIYLWTINILHSARHLYAKYGFIMTEKKENTEWSSEKLMEERWDLDLHGQD